MKLSGHEVTDQIQRALRGEIAFSLIGSATWDEAFGDVSFRFGDWAITFFNDCGDLDYCDSARAPDGREGEYEDWCAVPMDDCGDVRPTAQPLDLLSADELRALDRLLREARPCSGN